MFTTYISNEGEQILLPLKYAFFVTTLIILSWLSKKQEIEVKLWKLRNCPFLRTRKRRKSTFVESVTNGEGMNLNSTLFSILFLVQFSSVQSLSRVQLFVIP